MLYEPWAHADHLLKMFPPGKTSADEVLFRWRPHIPDISLDRAESDSHWDSKLRARFAAVEKKSGLAVARCNRFYLSLDVQCWFYYDERGMVVHAETEGRPYRNKTPNKAPEPTPGPVTSRADGLSEMKSSRKARLAPGPVVAHL